MKTKLIFFLLITLSLSGYGGKTTKIVILHTNDTHSQVEPDESTDMGGYARRLGLINKIRSEEKNVLLFDAGDYFQGTPYFNLQGGRIEARALLMMDYDAVTLGNHEFDNGMDSFAVILKDNKLPIVNANYDLRNTPLAPFVKPYMIFRKGGLKIGVFGIGVNLNGLTFQNNIAGLLLHDPVKSALETSTYLKETLKCDLVVCLSHLGANSIGNSLTDYDVIAASKNIDVVIGGHSHTLLVGKTAKNADGKPVVIAQMGKSGENLGRIDLTFEKIKVKK